MGVFDWIGDALFGDPEKEAPKYQAPPSYQAPTPYTYSQYQAPAIDQNATELPTVQGDNLSQLGALFSQLLNQYQTTGSATAPGVEQAMMDEARRGVQYDTGQAQQQISENMNRLNLLNSTAHGTAQALTQQNGLRNILDAQSRVLQQRQQNQQNMMQFGQSLAPIFTQRAQAMLQPRQWGYEQQAQNARFGHEQGQQASQYGYGQAQQAGQFGYGQQMQNAENQYSSQANAYKQKQDRNNSMFQSLLGLANPLNWVGGSSKSISLATPSYGLTTRSPSQYFGFGGY